MVIGPWLDSFRECGKAYPVHSDRIKCPTPEGCSRPPGTPPAYLAYFLGSRRIMFICRTPTQPTLRPTSRGPAEGQPGLSMLVTQASTFNEIEEAVCRIDHDYCHSIVIWKRDDLGQEQRVWSSWKAFGGLCLLRRKPAISSPPASRRTTEATNGGRSI